jgi:hypothetical protein
MNSTYWLQIFALSGSAICTLSQAACVAPTLVLPTQIEISEASPRFEWTPVGDAHHYLVWLESRIPEGRVLLTEEFQTSTTFLIPPRPLTSSKATVRIRLTAVCNDNTQAVRSERFRIDADSTCSLEAPPKAESENGQWRLHWEKLSFAQRYEVRVHASEDGKPVLTRESNETAMNIGRLESGKWVLAVQPVCRGLKGINSWVAIENPSIDPH